MMSTPESGPGAAPEGHVCEEGSIWDEASGKCVPVEQASSKDPSATGEVNMSLKDRIERTVRAYFDEVEKNLSKMIDDKIDKVVKAKESEVESALRKSFGIDKDPVIHMSDLESFARKIQVETAKTGKRSPASPAAGTGPEGNVTEVGATTQGKKIDSLMKEYGVKA